MLAKQLYTAPEGVLKIALSDEHAQDTPTVDVVAPSFGGVPVVFPGNHYCFRKFIAEAGQLTAEMDTLKDQAGPREQSMPGGEV